MSVTVIVPSLPERADQLEEMLDDWAAQTVPAADIRVGLDTDRRGPAVIRNELAAGATTEWLAFADDDDRFEPHHLETLLAHSDDADVVWTFCRVEGENWEPDHRCPPELGQIPVTSLVRRSLFEQVGGFPPGMDREDEVLYGHLLAAGARFQCVHDITWTYVFHGHNRSRAHA